MTDVRTYAYHCRGASKKSATAGTPPGKVESFSDSAGKKSNLCQIRLGKSRISPRFGRKKGQSLPGSCRKRRVTLRPCGCPTSLPGNRVSVRPAGPWLWR
jgi:hypothetical protein